MGGPRGGRACATRSRVGATSGAGAGSARSRMGASATCFGHITGAGSRRRCSWLGRVCRTGPTGRSRSTGPTGRACRVAPACPCALAAAGTAAPFGCRSHHRGRHGRDL
jgi:hypothetical protein